jgi:hypothetical protein
MQAKMLSWWKQNGKDGFGVQVIQYDHKHTHTVMAKVFSKAVKDRPLHVFSSV